MKTKLIIILIFIVTHSYAQREFWGLKTSPDNGAIFKSDINGANISIVYYFDGTTGSYPRGRLFLASNGKIYGTAFKGGYAIPDANNTGGVLFEYDLILDQYRVVANFGNSELPSMINPESGVIESTPGILYGTTSFGGIFKYIVDTEVITQAGPVPSIGGSIQNPMIGELVKASNGNIYGVTQNYSACPANMPLIGAIVRLNPDTGAFSFIYPFNCTTGDGKAPSGSLIEAAPGKLYGTTWTGGTQAGTNLNTTDGVLFEYDIITNTYTKKINFDHNTTGSSPGPLSLGDNGKLYGILSGGGKDPLNPNQEVMGTLYEYDISTNTVTIKHYFNKIGFDYPTGSSPRTNTLLKSSDGFFYGVNSKGLFKYDPANTDTATNVTIPGSFMEYSDSYGDLIEICRKPSYRYFEEDTFMICTGAPFTFDIHNTNATSYTWKKDGILLATQNTGILSLGNTVVSDSGDYVCEMVNECGITITKPLHLNVEACLGLDEAFGLKNAIKLYPNPVKDILNIQVIDNKNIEIQKITIRNILGQVIYSDWKNQLNIDIKNLIPGLYYVELNTDKGNWSAKFIKE